MKILDLIFASGFRIFPIWILYFVAFALMVSIDQWNRGWVFYTGFVFGGLWIVAMLYTLLRKIWKP